MNRITKQACQVLKDRPQLSSIRQFWDAMGRPDVVSIPEHQLSCAYREAANVAHKEIRARRMRAEGKAAPRRPRPLRQFMTYQVRLGRDLNARTFDPPNWEVLPLFHHYSLHATRGWRRERITPSEARYFHKKYGVPFVDERLRPVRLKEIAA